MTIEHIKIISLLKNQFALGSLKKKTNKLLWGKLLGIRNNYLIIDLNYTILNLYKTINIIKYLFLYKRKVFVIDWDLSILSDMIDILDTTEQYYLCGKWIFGFLTNIRNFRMLYEKFFYFLKELKSNILEKKQKLTKKKSKREYFNYYYLLETFSHFYFKKLSFSFNSNIFQTNICPSYILVFGLKKNYGAYTECQKLNILFSCIIDSDEVPGSIFPLYGNGDSASSKIYFTRLIRAIKFFNILNEFFYFFKLKRKSNMFNSFLNKSIIHLIKKYKMSYIKSYFFTNYFFEEFKIKKNIIFKYFKHKKITKIRLRFYTKKKKRKKNKKIIIYIGLKRKSYIIQKFLKLVKIPYTGLLLKNLKKNRYKNIYNIYKTHSNFKKIYISLLNNKKLNYGTTIKKLSLKKLNRFTKEKKVKRSYLTKKKNNLLLLYSLKLKNIMNNYKLNKLIEKKNNKTIQYIIRISNILKFK